MYVPPTTPPGYAPQGVPPVGYAPPPPSAQNVAPAPPVNIMVGIISNNNAFLYSVKISHSVTHMALTHVIFPVRYVAELCMRPFSVIQVHGFESLPSSLPVFVFFPHSQNHRERT